MKWGTADIEYEYFYNGARIDRDLLTAISTDIGTLEDVESLIEVHAVRWRIMTAEGLEACYTSFKDFAEGCSAHCLRVVFVFDGANFMHAVDVGRLFECPNRWEVVTTERDEGGQYLGRNKEAYIERSGTNGERYSSTLWTRSKTVYGDRHKRLRPTSFIDLDNIFTFGRAKALEVWGGGYSGLAGVVQVVKNFNTECKANGIEWLTNTRVKAETVGALAKQVFLPFIGGADYVKQVCAIQPKTYRYLNNGRLMRGGIVYCNPKYQGKSLSGVYGYDVRSEYLRVAATMPELTGLCMSSWEEYQNDTTGQYTYIITFDYLFLSLRAGEIPTFKGIDGAQVEGGTCAYENAPICVFAEELEAIQDSYDILDFSVHTVLKAKRKRNRGYMKFGAVWYGHKRESEEQGNASRRELAKFIINSSLGKLAQKSVYEEVRHVEYKPLRGMVKAEIIQPEYNKLMTEHGALNFVQGAYVTALARCYWIKTMRAICGGHSPADVIVYGDTDSFYSLVPAPPELIGMKCGYLKCECNNGIAKFLGKKCYAYIDGTRTEVHIAGMRKSDYLAHLYTIYKREPTPVEAVESLAPSLRVPVRVNIVVPYGRADILRWRSLNGENDFIHASGHTFGRGKNSLKEI